MQIVKLSFTQVMRSKDKVGLMFYERLFDIATDVRPLFKGDIAEQSRKLMDTLALAVGMLRDMPTLVMTLEALAKRHVGYGVKDPHYDKVGEALGAHGEYVTKPEDFRPALERCYQIAAKESRPAVINCQAKKEFWLRQQFPPGFLGTVEPGCMSYNH